MMTRFVLSKFAAIGLALFFQAVISNQLFADSSSSTQPSTQPDAVDVSQIHYTVEYDSPTRFVPFGDVEVTFFDDATDPQIVAVLTAELAKQVQKDEPHTDVMTTAWLHRPGTASAEDSVTGDSQTFPIYVSALKQTMSVSEAEKTGKLQKN